MLASGASPVGDSVVCAAIAADMSSSSPLASEQALGFLHFCDLTLCSFCSFELGDSLTESINLPLYLVS